MVKKTFRKKDLQLPVTERIKTFEDACRELGEVHCFVTEYRLLRERVNSPDLLAYLKLRIICAALNEGCEPQFTEDEARWYPWFILYSVAAAAELAKNSEECETPPIIVPLDNYRVVGRAYCYAYVYDGLFVYAGYSYSNANFGVRLALKSEDLCVYAVRQFATLWADFYLIRK